MSVGPRGACAHCYAENLDDHRFGRVKFGNHPRVRSAVSTWAQPRAWNRKAARDGVKRFVFCSHLSDVFDNQVDPTWRADLFLLIHETPNLIWLLLTKRPQNILSLGPAPHMWPRNAAVGCTVVTQEEADRDVPKLLAAKAAVNPAFAFVSMEPLLGPVDLTALPTGRLADRPLMRLNALTGRLHCGPAVHDTDERLDWVITGGETDQGKGRARPSHPEWFASVQRQCAEAGVPYHHKQNGEWHPWTGREPHTTLDRHGWLTPAGEFTQYPDVAGRWDARAGASASRMMVKIGKAAAGRLLDGVTHDARPEHA